MLQLIIAYIWFGQIIPEDYLLSLADEAYPIRILFNPPPINNMPQYETTLEKSWRYRLQYLKNGGVYSDFGMNINYKCLMQKISDFKGEMMAMRIQGQYWSQRVPNYFLYVPADRTNLIGQILENQGKNCSKTHDCNGPEMLNKYRSRITLQNLDECLKLGFNSRQYNETNKKQKTEDEINKINDTKWQISRRYGQNKKQLQQLQNRINILEDQVRIAQQKQSISKQNVKQQYARNLELINVKNNILIKKTEKSQTLSQLVYQQCTKMFKYLLVFEILLISIGVLIVAKKYF